MKTPLRTEGIMHVIQTILIYASIYMPVIIAQTNIWYEQMNTDPILSWSGSKPTVLSNDASCPDPYRYCWSFTSTANIMYTASTIGYTNVQLTYFVSANKINTQDKCSIYYSVDATNWNVIRQITSNTAVTTEAYSSWPVAVDDISLLTIMLTYSGSGHNCYFTEFILSGTPITPQPTNTTPSPTFAPSVSTELDLICHQNECADRNIECPSNTCNIYCDGSESCSGMIVNATNTSSVSVQCVDNHACIYMSIYATNADDFTLDCNAAYSCNAMAIFANSTGVTTINATSNYALSDSTLSASVYEFQISCTSKSSEYACVNNDWYLPKDYNASNVYINCYGDGCKKFGNVYMDLSVSELTVNINGCGECKSAPTCIEVWSIHCYNFSLLFPWMQYSTTIDEQYCADDGAVHLLNGIQCDCGVMKDSITYIDDSIDSQCAMTETTEAPDDFDIKDIMNILNRLTGLGLGVMIAIGAVALCLCLYICCMLLACCGCCKNKKKYQKPSSYQGQCMTNPNPAITMVQPQPQPAPPLQIVYVESLDVAQQQQPLESAHVQHQPSWDIAEQQQSLDIAQQQQQGQQPQVIEMQDVEVVMQGYQDNASVVSMPSAPPEYEAVAQDNNADIVQDGEGGAPLTNL